MIRKVSTPDGLPGRPNKRRRFYLMVSLARAGFAVVGLFLVALVAQRASSQVLYTTGFEPSPASPAWVTGQMAGTGGQNSWGDSDTSSPSGNGLTAYANAAFRIVSNNYSLSGPQGTESIPAASGTQMVDSATTYVAGSGGAASNTTVYTNLAYTKSSIGIPAAWTADHRTTLETSVQVYIPSVDSSLDGLNGLTFFAGALGLTNQGTVGFANSSGVLYVTVMPAVGTTITDTAITNPGVLQRDTWLTLTTYLNYNNGDLTVDLTNGSHSLSIVEPDLFDTAASFFSSEIANANSTADASMTDPNANAFFDNYTITATSPSPGALPVFASGLAAFAPWVRRRGRPAI